MSRRIEVELTSQRPDGAWTWRAAGAKQPKGVVDGSLLYEGAAVGDVVRADADFNIDGIDIVAVLTPKPERAEPERLELLGDGPSEGGVTTSLVGRRGRRGRDRDDGERDGRGRSGSRGGGGRRGGGTGGGRRDGGRGEGGRRPKGERRDRPRTETPDRPPKPKPKRLRPGRTHRNAWLAELPEEQKVVAEQLVRGGLAGVRKEIDAENARAREAGRPEIKADSLVALAEQLVPKLRVAEWRDRADAALKDLDELDLRDLRSVVVAADDAARDRDARELADRLREGLTARVDAAQREWLDEISELLDEGRVVRALRLSSRPPKAGAPLPAELGERLVAATNEALQGDIGQQRLGVVLDAVAFSPIRQRVELPDVPADPGEELMATVRKVAQHIPDIAARFGVEPTGRRSRSRARGGAPPPPPPRSAEPAASGSEGPAD